MTRLAGCSLIWLAITIVAVHGAPARPLYEPPEPAKIPTPTVASLHGTAWQGKYNTITRIFIFEPDGTLSYRTVSGKPYKMRGTWRMEGNTLFFDHHIKPGATIMEFRGTIRDANTIVGESTTKAGVKTEQVLRRTDPK